MRAVGYRAPEVEESIGNYGPKADVYSLGVALLEMAIADPSDRASMQGPPVPDDLDRLLPGDHLAELRAFIKACTIRCAAVTPSPSPLLG